MMETCEGNDGEGQDDGRRPHRSDTGGSGKPEGETKARKRKKPSDGVTTGGSTLHERWEEMFERLRAFKEKTGHCNVPNRYAEDPQLGFWGK
jgi:hypothetical protein